MTPKITLTWSPIVHKINPKWPSNGKTINLYTQEADSLKCSKPMPKVVVGVPRVLKVFSWVFIYKVHKKIGLGPKKSVKPGYITPSVIENFEKNEHVLAVKFFHEIGKKWKNRKHFILTVLKVGLVKFFFFWNFWPFSCLFWRVLKKHFEKKMSTFWPPPKKYEIGKK